MRRTVLVADGDVIDIVTIGEGDDLKVFLEVYDEEDVDDYGPISEVKMDRESFGRLKEAVDATWKDIS